MSRGYWHFMQIQIIVQLTTSTKIILWEKFWNNPKPFHLICDKQSTLTVQVSTWQNGSIHTKSNFAVRRLIFLLICIMNLKKCCHGNKKSPDGYCVGPLMRRSWLGLASHALTLVASCGLVWCSSGCSSPFLVALSSFLTPECLLHHDGAWPNAIRKCHSPTGWLHRSFSHMHYWPLFQMSISWTVGHETLSGDVNVYCQKRSSLQN